MRRRSAFWIITVSFSWLWAGHAACGAEIGNLDLLLDAIAMVESHNNADAVGDGGRAIGVYQIHRLYWKDGTRILGVDWKYEEAKDSQKSRQVVRAYLLHYGKGKRLLDMARIHNGGPNGHRKKATRRYAGRVKAVMDKSVENS